MISRAGRAETQPGDAGGATVGALSQAVGKMSEFCSFSGTIYRTNAVPIEVRS